MTPVRISYFSDVLCVWAYAARRRVEELADNFGDKVSIETHFCPVFPDARRKIAENWKDREGFQGFNRHINEVAERFPHIEVRRDLWLKTRPRTSMTAHIFLKAISLIESEDTTAEFAPKPGPSESLSGRADRAVRQAFFAQGEDISNWHVLSILATKLGVDEMRLIEKLQSSEAIAALAADTSLAQANSVTVSPTYLMNEGRQKLTGNVGYRVLEANVEELLRAPKASEASWC